MLVSSIVKVLELGAHEPTTCTVMLSVNFTLYFSRRVLDEYYISSHVMPGKELCFRKPLHAIDVRDALLQLTDSESCVALYACPSGDKLRMLLVSHLSRIGFVYICMHVGCPRM